jgi:naphthoate synthase
MSARDDVSEIFDSSAWRPVEGFDFADITYHRAVDAGVVRIAFDRPEVRNAFRPQSSSPRSSTRGCPPTSAA